MEKTKKNTDNRFGRWLQKCKKHPFSGLAEALVWLSGIMTMAIMIYLVAFISDPRRWPHLKPSLFSLTYNSDNVSLSAGTCKYTDHNGAVPGDRNSVRGICGDLPCGICKKRKPSGPSDPCYGRDPFWHSFDCLRSVRTSVFQHGAALGPEPVIRLHDSCRCDSPADHPNFRGGASFCAGFLPGGVFWTWRRETAHDF